MDKKQLIDTIEQIDFKILEHISNDEFNVKHIQIPDYLLTARRVLIDRFKDIESKEKEDDESEIFNKIRNNVAEYYINQMGRRLGGIYKGTLLCEKDVKETFYPSKNK